MNKFLVFIVSLCITQLAAAQIKTTFSGAVFLPDSAKATTRATITIKTQLSIIAFGFTNEKGEYTIETLVPDTGSYFLEVKKMGFSTQTIPVHIALADTLLHHDFYLESSSKPMEEVVIKNIWKQRENKDTIEFNASQFQTPQTRKVEDVLKNIDGFSVAENGRISYRGKEVKALLVNGDDLTQDQYTLLSKNLNADILDKIQVIDNYSSNRILGTLTKSNEVAVNLKLKTNLFGKVSGAASAGYAPSKKFDVDGSMMMLKPKLTIIQLLAGNNVSKSVAGNAFFENENAATGIALSTSTENKMVFMTPVSGAIVSLPPIASDYKLHNNVKMASTLFHLRVNKIVKASGKVSYYNNGITNVATSSSLTVVDSNTKWQTYNEENLSLKSSGLLTTFNVLHDNTRNFTGSGSFKWLHLSRENLFSSVTHIAIADSLQQNVNSKANLFAASYTGVVKAAENGALSIIAFYNHLPGQSALEETTERYAAYFNSNENLRNFRQQTAFWLSTAGMEMNLLQKRNNQFQKYSLSYLYESLKGNNELNASKEFEAAQNLWNSKDLSNRQQQAQFNLSRVYSLTKKTSLKAGGSIGINLFKKRAEALNTVVWNMQAEATYKLKAFSHFSAAITSVKKMPSLQMFFPDSLLEGNGMIRFSAVTVKPIQYNEANISFSYFKFRSQTSLMANAWFRHSPSDYTVRFYLTPSFLQSQYVPVANNTSKGALLSGKKFIYPLRSTVSFSTFLQQDKEQKIINERGVVEKNLNLNYTLRIITSFKIPVNTELSYSYFLFKGNQLQDDAVLTASSSFFMVENKYRIQLSKKLYMGLQYNFFKPEDEGHHLASLFASYRLSEKSSFDIKGHNLFNERFYIRNAATNNVSYSQSFANVPFYFLVRFNHSF